jgi:hypothetical protein
MTASGVYLKATDITASLAKYFLTDTLCDMQPYFDHADSEILGIVRDKGLQSSDIAVDQSGNLYDVNLKRYGVLHLYRLLFSDNRRKGDYTDPGTLSDGVSFDKYVNEIKDIDKEIASRVSKITYSTIQNIAYSADSAISVFELSRG